MAQGTVGVSTSCCYNGWIRERRQGLLWFSGLVTYLTILPCRAFFRVLGLWFLRVWRIFTPIFWVLYMTVFTSKHKITNRPNSDSNTDFVKLRYCEGILNKLMDGIDCQNQPNIYKSCKLIELRFTSLFLSLTVLLSTERVLLIFLIVWGCWAPELPICASIWGAGIVGLSHVDEREHTRLTIRVATISLVPGLCTDREGRACNLSRDKAICI